MDKSSTCVLALDSQQNNKYLKKMIMTLSTLHPSKSWACATYLSLVENDHQVIVGLIPTQIHISFFWGLYLDIWFSLGFLVLTFFEFFSDICFLPVFYLVIWFFFILWSSFF